jgi:hypothetical protein
MDPHEQPDGPDRPGPESGEKPEQQADKAKKLRRRRRRRPDSADFERISEVHYCRSDYEANQYLALGPEWDLQDILPMRVETDDGGERDEIHFIVARWENDRDRARLRKRDREYTVRRKQPGD